MFGLTGHIALVTGGSRRLGLAMAEARGRAGAGIVITAGKSAPGPEYPLRCLWTASQLRRA